MREKEIEEKFRDAVKRAGGKAYKFVSPGNDGVPDRLVILPEGRIGFVEVKAPGRKPTALQKARIHELESLGCQVLVLDDAGMIPGVLGAIRGEQAEKRGRRKAGKELET